MNIKNTTQNYNMPIDTAKNTCDSLFDYAIFLYDSDIEVEKRLEINSVYENVKNIFKNIRYDHSNLLLALQESELRKNENYLYSHTVRTSILALIIGKYLNIPTHKLIELGVAALLHDIGMLSVPEELYLQSLPLTKEEKTILDNHPKYGFKILTAHNYSSIITLAVLEHHEREDGTGYPRKLTRDNISLFGKIIAVACSYEAISARRKYKDSLDLHTGIVEMLKNKSKYNNAALMALVNSLSLYPVGLYVLLSDGNRGQVIDINSKDPRYPVVQILDEKTNDGKIIKKHTFSDGLHIIRPLRNDEIT